MRHKLTQREELWLLVMRNSRFSGIDYAAKAKVGDIVLLQSAPNSIWEVSELLAIEPICDEHGRPFDYRYTLRAVGTDEVCDWTNVGLLVYKEDKFSGHARLRETPSQYAFRKKWQAEGRKAELYMMLQGGIEYDGQDAICHWRGRHGLGEGRMPEPARFVDYRQTTRAEMRSAIKAAEAAYEKAA